ncbi:MAG: ABC transporter permease [Deltaproteobacteria bacterium]|nr:ABC transporter permease [Deltaproteobacteria bacterium]
MQRVWRLAARNLARNRRRNLATGLAIAIGYASLVLVGGYVSRVESYLRTATVYLQQVGHVSIFAKDGLELHLLEPSKYNLTKDQQEKIEAHLRGRTDVELFGRALEGTGLIGNGCKTYSFFARGIDLDLDAKLRVHPEVASHAKELATPRRGASLVDARDVEGAVALAEGLANKLGKTKVHAETGTIALPIEDCGAPGVFDRFTEDANVQLAGASFDGSFAALDGEVVGIFSTGLASSDDVTVWAPVEHLQLLYDTDQVTSYSVYLRDVASTEEVGASVRAALESSGAKVDVLTYEDEDLNPYYVGTVKFLLVMAGLITSVVVFVVTLSIVNSTTMTIFERTREIGALRSLGFTRSQVMGLFVREGLVLSAASLGAGFVLALGASAFIASLGVRIHPPGLSRPIQFLVTPAPLPSLVLALAIAAMGALATLVATRRIARENVAKLNSAATG